MQTAVIIVAAGRGRRVGGPIPKQWRDLGGKTVLARTLGVFLAHAGTDRIVLVLHPQDMAMAPGYEGHGNVVVVAGGESRAASVRAGLEALEGAGIGRVLIHDAARPLVDHRLIDRVLGALEHAPGAAPGLAVSDALWRGKDSQVTGSVERDGLYRAQTPQGFDFERILAAHRAHGDAAANDLADDVAVAMAAGIGVAIVAGDARNLKIATEADFARAEGYLGFGMDIRVGNGFDVHRFGPGDHVMLCGVRIGFDRALQGHSDGDVGIHALCDAIYGALGEGDIGRHFPPSEVKWRGADSALFLEHAMGRASARGYRLGNADVTLICEAPKVGPHASAMVARLARIMEVETTRLGVKATTTERLGFAGRGEGIAASATATLVRP